ncbi:MAG: M14 family zinc carboxypeptidase, partial [Pseudohongiella sp.]|nr:M14 family zinc carboxypeptidase [Pseudohongiella sp.]
KDLSEPVSRILIMGGIHGDEYSSISIMFKWMNLLASNQDSDFHWRFLPLANPDGLLDGEATRQNANGVDLNRNFPSGDWERTALESWRVTTGSNPRRFPGHSPASEPETQWILQQIEEFKPVVIVSVHAPHALLDFDGPVEAPHKIGHLHLHQLGVYPGSLGNYGGLDLGIPVITLELPSAGIMPSKAEIENMWVDLNNWLNDKAPGLTKAKTTPSSISAD